MWNWNCIGTNWWFFITWIWLTIGLFFILHRFKQLFYYIFIVSQTFVPLLHWITRVVMLMVRLCSWTRVTAETFCPRSSSSREQCAQMDKTTHLVPTGEVDHGGAVLRPHPPTGGRHCQAVRGRVHRLDDGPGLPQGLHASASGQGTQLVHPNHPQAPLQRLCTEVGSTRRPSCALTKRGFQSAAFRVVTSVIRQ